MTDKGSKKISIIIADDHAVVRQGLSTFLELQDDIEVVGEASNGIEAIEKTEQYRPDIILMDLEMPQMDGIEATRQIHLKYPDTKIIVLTSFATKNKILPAIKAGASSYELKDVSPTELVNAIRLTDKGETHLHPKVAKQLMENISNNSGAHQPEELTERELEVLKLIAKGYDNRRIAKELSISEKTVKTHVSNILFKLDLDSRTQAAIYALKSDLV
jgi:two-component system, NarL family, response regulator LiaR